MVLSSFLRVLLMRLCILIIASVLFMFRGVGYKADAAIQNQSIRIAIVKNAQSVSIDGGGVLATREDGFPLVLSQSVTVRSIKNSMCIDGVVYRRLKFASSSVIYVNGKPYHGSAEIIFSEKGLLVINELPLEEYLVGLINCEISSAWPIEAVKAQAVIARTYALSRKESRKNSLYHLESTVIDQVYEGSLIEDSRAKRAVSETSGEVLVYRSEIIQAFYHSSCGGKTEAAINVWGASLPYLKGVDCEYCLLSPSSLWEQKLSLKEMDEKLRTAGFKVSGVSDVRLGARNNRGRLTNIVILSSLSDVAVSGDQFRKAIGYGVIKSTNFTVKVGGGEVSFSGSGNGHGVGLCQWGAKQRAVSGFEYNEILSYYYPGTELKKLSEIR